MDITTGQRTFFIGLSGTQQIKVVDIPFVDTSGNKIKCNYFSITAGTHSNSNTVTIAVEASGISKVGNMISNSLSATAANPAASGICGIGLVASLGSIKESWHGANGEVCTGVKLHIVNHDTNPHWFIGLTYGNLFPFNTIRADMYGSGAYNRGL